MIKFLQKRIIKWEALCNSSINNETAFIDEHLVHTILTKSDFLPRVGDYIQLNGKNIEVKKVIHNVLLNEVIIYISPIVQYVDYYDYMKTFTHCYDYMKSEKDITRDISDSYEYESILPETWEGWMKDIEILCRERKLSNKEKIKLADLRCKKVDN